MRVGDAVRRLFKRGREQPAIPRKPGGLSAEGQIPRYPPFVEGTPAVGVDELLDSQDRLIIRVQEEVGLTPDKTAAYVDPVIRTYARHVHLLPASATHHHRGPGGLFRHGLETAMWGIQALRGELVGRDVSPEERYFEEPKWRYAALIACLGHDIGKIVTDMQVVTEDPDQRWSPYKAPLADWLRQEKVDRYWVRWTEDRYQSHETVGVGFIERLIPESAYDWLHGEKGEFIALLHRYLSGSEPRQRDQAFYGCIRWGDRVSVKRDLEGQMLVAGDDRQDVPVARYITDAMRRLLADRRWTINEPGARIWMGEGGEAECYLLWPEAAEDAVRQLREDEVPGIPGDTDDIARLLWDRFILGDLDDEEKQAELSIEDPGPMKVTIAPEVLRQENGELVWLTAIQLNPYAIGVPEDIPGVKLHHPEDAPASSADEEATSSASGSSEPTLVQQPMEQPAAGMEQPLEQGRSAVEQPGVPTPDPAEGTSEKAPFNQSVPMERFDGTPGGSVPVPGHEETPKAKGREPADEAEGTAFGKVATADGIPDGTNGTGDGTPSGTRVAEPDLSDLDSAAQTLVKTAARTGWEVGRRSWAVSLEELASEPDQKPLQIVQPYQAYLEPDPERPMTVIRKGAESGKYVVLQRTLGKRVEEVAAALVTPDRDPEREDPADSLPGPDGAPVSAAGSPELDPAVSRADELAAPHADPVSLNDATPEDGWNEEASHPIASPEVEAGNTATAVPEAGAGNAASEPDTGAPKDPTATAPGRGAAQGDRGEAALLEELGEAFQEWVNEQAQLDSAEQPSWVVPGAHAHWVALDAAGAAFHKAHWEWASQRIPSPRKLIVLLERTSVVDTPLEVPAEVEAGLTATHRVQLVRRR